MILKVGKKDKDSVILTKEEMNKDIILDKIKKRVYKKTQNKIKITEEDREKIIIHSLSQIEYSIDNLTNKKFSLNKEKLVIKVKRDKENNFFIDNNLFIRYPFIDNTKESILKLIDELIETIVDLSIKGVFDKYGYIR